MKREQKKSKEPEDLKRRIEDLMLNQSINMSENTLLLILTKMILLTILPLC